MKKQIVCLMLLLSQTAAYALEETVAGSADALLQGSIEGTGFGLGQTMAEVAVAASEESTRTQALAWLTTPEAMSALAISTSAFLLTTYAVKKWNAAETRRRYRAAATQAEESFAAHVSTPISLADPRSSLPLVSEVEAKILLKQNPSLKLSETELAGLVVARSKHLEAELQ